MVASFESQADKLILYGDYDRFNLADKTLYRFPSLNGDITIDLAGVKSFDTAGLAFLLKMVSFYQKKSNRVIISNESSQLIALAEISNVIKLLPFAVK